MVDGVVYVGSEDGRIYALGNSGDSPEISDTPAAPVEVVAGSGEQSQTLESWLTGDLSAAFESAM